MKNALIETIVRSRAPSRLVPYPFQCLLLEHLFERLFRDAYQRGELDFLGRRWVRIHVLDAGFVWSVTCGNRGLTLTRDRFRPDVEFRGLLEDFILLAARRVDPDSLFFQRRIEIHGDTDLAVACKNLLDAADDALLPWPLRRFLDLAADHIESLRNAPQAKLAGLRE